MEPSSTSNKMYQIFRCKQQQSVQIIAQNSPAHKIATNAYSVNRLPRKLSVDIGSDDDPVLTTMQLKIKRFSKSPHIRLDLEKVKDPNL